MENSLSLNIGKGFKTAGEPISYLIIIIIDDSSYLFHLDYLVPAMKKRGFCSPYSKKKEEQQHAEIHFEMLEIDDNVRLAIAPLNERKNKYLCLYVESSAPNQEIISQLRNAII